MKHTGDYELDEINMLEQECADLEEENKMLERENTRLKSDIDAMIQNERWYKYDINKLEKENKKLNLKIAELMGQRDWKQMLIDMLEVQNKELIKRIKGHVPTQILADFRHTMSDLHNKFKK